MTPDTFGPYQLRDLIGRGGMGEVYRAYDTRRQRTVALKRLRPEFVADEKFRGRFLKECRRAARLTQAHVIPIHDFGEIDGRLYLDMRLIEGDNLAEAVIAAGYLARDRGRGARVNRLRVVQESQTFVGSSPCNVGTKTAPCTAFEWYIAKFVVTTG